MEIRILEAKKYQGIPEDFGEGSEMTLRKLIEKREQELLNGIDSLGPEMMQRAHSSTARIAALIHYGLPYNLDSLMALSRIQ